MSNIKSWRKKLLKQLAEVNWGITGLHEAVMKLKIEGYNIRIPYDSDPSDSSTYRSLRFISSAGLTFRIILPRHHHVSGLPVKSVEIRHEEDDTSDKTEVYKIIQKLMQYA